MTKEQEEAIEMLEDIKNNTWTTKYIMSSDSKKAETVLNMLKEKDKEIKTLTQTNKSYKGIINKKDRQIDLMARAFKQDDVRTVEEIKQYFERKANNEN